MSAWNIYHKDGSKLTDVNGEQITVHGLEYSDSWMGECFLTINFKHEVPINFQIGDYIVYRGERFELNYEPGKDKQARPDTYGEGFVYDSVKFNALQDELARAEFLDVVLNDNELHYTSLPKFPFYVQTLDDLLDRIQACLNEQIGAGLWKIYSRNKDRSVQRGALESEWLSVYGEKTDDNVIESMSITVDSQTCWQALALVNEKWDINFIVRGRNIYVGTTGIQANHIFKYGLGNGLYEIVQNADSDQSVVTRLRAYGSEKNLPSHYYADLGVKYVANITKVVGASTNVTLELDLDYIETYFKNPRKYIVPGETGEQSLGWVLKVTFDFKTEITGYVTQAYDSKKCRFYSELKGTQTDTGDEESKEKLDAFIAQVKAENTKMYITSGLNKKAVPSSMKEYAKNLPNNMSINRLMLPGFPHVSLSDFYNSLTNEEKKYVNPTGRQHKFSTDPHRPYIDSINIEQIGLRSASQFFETDDKTNGVIEIYPTIEEMEIGGVRVDEIDEGVAPDDDGRFGDNETVKNVDIYLKKAIDFDINDLKDDDFSISMKDGMCGGRTFKVASSAKIDGRWRLTIERVKDDALELWFPYKDYPIKNGDHFVLTGITLPDSYVNAASLKLLKYAIAFIDKNDYTRYVYQPKVDEIFMARQHDLAEKDTTGVIKSLHDTLKAGDLMEFEDTDLRIGGVISIDQLTIKEEDGKIPTYDITLREDKEVGTIQKIQQQISSLQSGNGGTGAGLTTTQVKGQIATEGSKHFISKINDDIANGTITWEKVQKFFSGLLIGNSNNENGGSWTPDAEGRSHLITDYLEVRMKAIFEELVINKTSTIGGKEIISPAGGVVAHKVEEVTVTYNNVSQKAYRCYFLAEQEGDAVDNDFAVGDQVRSESFNVRKGTYHKVGNHFYWRLVIGRDEDPVELEGKKYHYIDLSDTDCATASDVPAKGDVLNQCGNRTDVERQNCLIFSAVDTYSPSISLYHGINSYSFANREYVEYGVNKQNNKAFFNVYGDMYVGDRPTKENGYEGSSYIRYDSSTKQMSVKAKISAKSTVDGKELSQYFKKIGELQNQVDGAIETWFYEGVPTLENAPAISWKTDKDKEIHLGDLYYDNKTGKAYRFAKDSNTYKWTIITDTDIAKALSDARMAQETANGKMKVFSVQPTTPYQVGDIWVNATYPSDGSTYKNEVLRCQTNKAAGSQFAIGDWIKASKYTDDTVANAAKKAAEDAQKAAQTAQKDITNLGKTVTDNKKEFDNYVTDGYLEPSEIAAMAQDSKRLEDDFAAAQKSYNEVKNAEVLKSTKELTDLNAAFATLTTAKTELVTDLSDISKRYNETDTNGKAAIVSAVGTKFTNFQSAYSAFYDKLGLANAYITSKIYGDLKQNITDLAGYKYLKDALGQTTDIDGGLVMTTLIALRDGDGNVQSGINGAIDKNRGKKSIAAWWGGQMVDKDYNSGNLTHATSLIRFDGSGYLANGAIWWDVSGKVHADPTSFIISEKNLGAYLIFFEPTWKEGSAGTSVADLVSLKPNAPFSKLGVSGDATFEGAISFHGIKLTYDATNKAIKIDGNLYATGGITAYGAGASTTGGGGGLNGSVKSYSNALKLTSESLSEIASAYSIKALDSRISSLEGGSATAISVSGSGNAVTSVTKNGTTISVVKGSTFLTSHQSLDGYVNAISVSGSGNAITSVSKSGKGITFTKGATFLTSHQSLANYYTKSSVDSLLSGKSATSHTHSVKINGVTKTIAATGGTAVDLGTYLTSHQSLANYVTINDSRLSDSRYPKFANGTWYLVGDDAYIGDHNLGGRFCIKSANNDYVSGIAIYNKAGSSVANLWFDNTNINLDKQLVMNNKRIWIQGVGTAGGNNNRLTLVAGMPSGLVFNTSCRGTILYSNGIAFADPYNGNSNNDSGWIRHLETSANNGTLEIAVGDNASNEQIHFRWYNTNTSAETIAHDITVPKATGTLALTSQIPTTLPANGGNADKLDGYHANGLLTALSNSDKGISITVGGTTKSVSNISVNYASSAGNADTVDGEHLIKNGSGTGIKQVYYFNTQGNNTSYIKLGTLNTVSVTGDGTSKVMFTVKGGIDFGRTNESVYEVAASTRGSIQVTSTLVRGNRELKFGYVSTSSNVEIWMAYDGTYRGVTEVEVSSSVNFTLTMTETTTKPSGFVEGFYRILAATADNVASATKLAAARTIWGQSFDGTGNVDGTLTITNSGSDDPHIISTVNKWFHIVSKYKLVLYAGDYNSSQRDAINILSNHNVGIGVDPSYKLHVAGDIYSSATIRTAAQNQAIILSNDASPAWISALEGQVIFNTGKAIRFGETACDWNQWAGLKYNHSDKTIYLGIANGSIFNANSPQSDGTLRLAGIKTVTPDSGARIGGSGSLYIGNANNSGWVYVQDMCSQVNSSYWNITQNGSAIFKSLTVNDVISCNSISVSKNAVIAGNLSVNGLINNKGILPTNYEVNNKGTNCYVSADELCSGITAITDSIPVDNLSIVYSNDNGTNWTNYNISNDTKFKAYANVAGIDGLTLGGNVITGNNDAEKLAQIKKNQLMFTFDVPNNCYSQVYFASVDITQGVGVTCTVEYLNSKGVIVNTFIKYMNGWNQFNYINLSNGNEGFPVGNDSRRYIRFKFKHDQNTTELRNASINKIRIFAFTKYSFPTDRFMGHTGHIYNFDYNMNTYFPNSILAKGGVTAYQSSDIRLKQDLRKLDYLGIIKAMGGTFGFAWKKDNTRSIGWIAQHVLCNPHLKDIVETDEKGYYKINYWSPKLIATAFGAIEQVGDEVSRLKARVVFLESEVQRLSGDKEDCNKKRLDNKNHYCPIKKGNSIFETVEL
jgi:hypothetical protein